MSKKDFWYIIGYFIFLIISIITFMYGGKNSEIVSYVGFGGTITSIILSVLAIIYAFFQNSTTISQTQQLNNLSSNISNASESLLTHTEELSKTSDRFSYVMQELQEYQLQVATALSSINAIGEQMSAVNNNISSIGGRIDELSGQILQPQSSQNSISADIHDEEIIDKLQKSSLNGLIILLSVVYISYRDESITLNDLIEKLTKNGAKNITNDYCFGFLVGFSATNIIRVKDINPIDITYRVDKDNFASLIEQEINKRIELNRKDKNNYGLKFTIDQFSSAKRILIEDEKESN